MKRFAVFALFLAGPAFAGETPAGPTTPQVPPPVIQNGLPANTPVFDSGPRSHHLTGLSRLLKKPAADSTVSHTGTPGVITHPPLPTALASVPYAPAACASPACSVSNRGDCCERLKKWLCYKPCNAGAPPPVPTPCLAPHYTFFTCKEKGGYAGGCAPGHANCGPVAGVPAPAAGPIRGLFARGSKEACAPSCDPRTGPVDAGMPGFRFAAPENRGVGGGAPTLAGAPPLPGTQSLDAAPVATPTSTAFKMPSYGAKPGK